MSSVTSYLGYYLNSSKDLITGVLPYLSLPATKPQIERPQVVDPSMVLRQISHSPWLKVAAISGACAVALGAYGTHGLKVTPEKKAIFETANRYHFYHSLALLSVPLFNRSKLAGALFISGILLFCGSCYCNAVTGNTKVVRVTPIGGFMFILGWLSLLF